MNVFIILRSSGCVSTFDPLSSSLGHPDPEDLLECTLVRWCPRERAFFRMKAGENQDVWGSDLFFCLVLLCVSLQTVNFLCLFCVGSALELGSLCRVSLCTSYRDLVRNFGGFCFSCHYIMSAVLQINIIFE